MIHLLLIICAGNLKQFFARDGAAFQHHVARDYGPVTKLHGFFNVRE